MTVPPSLRRAGRILGWSLLGLVLVLFFALAGGMAFLRTQPGERWIADTAVSVLKNVGIEAQIGSLEGPLPFSLHLREVRLADGQGVWLDSEKLGPDDEVREVLKHGTLSIGFIGLAECLKALTGAHHGESAEAQALGLEIIGRIRDRADRESAARGLNFSRLATPAEGLSGRFVRMDAKRFGVIPGVTDREYYTNSFHVPVYYPISAFDKLRIEAPYHALTNGGHISYIEMDGDPLQNLPAFEKVVRFMGQCGIGYGSINHPVDRDPVCGFNGIIGDTCPRCGRRETPAQPFERIRRITGYLVGTLDRFNNGKRAEERDRVKHGVTD